MDGLKEYSAVLKAAGDPTRARILKMLEEGELCVCQINAGLGLSQSTISKHLLVLKAAGLVRDRKDGRWVFYFLADRKVNSFAFPILALLKGWLESEEAIQEDVKKMQKIRQMDPHELCEKGLSIFRRNITPNGNMSIKKQREKSL